MRTTIVLSVIFEISIISNIVVKSTDYIVLL